jgi:hypothetical protein
VKKAGAGTHCQGTSATKEEQDMAHRARKLAIAVGIAGVAVGMVAGPASADEPSGSATGLEGLLETPLTDITLPPIPLITLPPGGENEVQSLSVPPLVSADILQVASNETGSNGAESSASVADVTAIDGVIPAVDGLTAGLITSACESNPSGSSAESAIVDGSALGIPLAVSPDPNTTIAVPAIGSITLNEQTKNGSKQTVRAVHVVVDTALGIGAEIAIATSVCDSGLGGGGAGGGSELPPAEPATPTSGTPTLAG